MRCREEFDHIRGGEFSTLEGDEARKLRAKEKRVAREASGTKTSY